MDELHRLPERGESTSHPVISLSYRKIVLKGYYRQRQSLERALDTLTRELQQLMERQGLHVTVKCRLKSFDSYYRKLINKRRETGTNGGGATVNDLLGVRVICPFQGDLRAVECVLRDAYSVLEVERKGRDQSYREFGYDSTHLLIRVPEHILTTAGVEPDLVCEVQVRTILQEAWAEIEHELVYKADLSPLDEPLRRKLASLKATLTLSDNIFQEIRDYQRQMQGELRLRRDDLWARIVQIAKLGFAGSPSRQSTSEERSCEASRDFVESKEPEVAEDIDVLLLRALSAHNRHQLGEALELYSRILAHELAPKARTIVLLHRGMAHFMRGDIEKAYDDFTAALCLDGGAEKACYFRGIASWALGRLDEAHMDFSQSLDRNPLQAEVLVCRALLRCQMGDSAGALADSEQVLAIAPDSAEARDLQDLLTVEVVNDAGELGP